jgi:hypothetical protein
MAKHIRKSKTKVLKDQAAQNLFRKFAAPLFRAANSPSRKKAAHRLAQMLWLALITGPETEEFVFQTLEGKAKLNSEDIQVIQDHYYREMRPVITEEELRALKARYKVKKLPRGEDP